MKIRLLCENDTVHREPAVTYRTHTHTHTQWPLQANILSDTHDYKRNQQTSMKDTQRLLVRAHSWSVVLLV